MSSDNTAFADEDGDCGDWIELLNSGDAAVSLEGWGLSDDAAAPLKWTFPAIALNTNETLIVWADGKDRRPSHKMADGYFVVAPSNTVCRYRDNGLAPDANWAATNYDDSAWSSGPAMLGYGFSKVATTVSYGADSNAKYPATYFRQIFVSPVGPADVNTNGVLRLWADDGAIIYLNGREILRTRMPAGTATYQTYASTLVGVNGDWETYAVPVTALIKGTNVLAAEVHQYTPSSSDIAFWAELSARPAGQHANFKISAGNETVTLSDATGAAVDTAPAMNVVLRDTSFGRAAGDPNGAWIMFPYPTPGAANSLAGYAKLLDAPGFSAAPGFYASPVTVAITNADPEAAIYYTFDGSTPTNAVTASCFLYSAPLTFSDRSSLSNGISMIRTNPLEMTNNTQYGWMAPAGLVPKCTVVRAMAYRSGCFSPRGAGGTWLIGGVPVQHTLRVVSLQSDYDNLFGDPRGIYVPGDIYNTLGWNGHYVGLPNANYFQSDNAWERPVYVQMFESDRTLAFSQLLGARIHGAWSRAAAQKTLCFYARNEYGDSDIDCRLFPNQTDTSFKRFLLRNSGNDWSSVGFRDAMMQQIFRTCVRCDTQDYAPAVVYINGEYWGVENIREQYSPFHLQRKYGIDPDAIDFVKADTAGSEVMSVEAGDIDSYTNVLAFVKANDLSVTENYAWVEQRMDLGNLIDFYACEIYCCNTDWPGNNLGLWRLKTDYNPGAAAGHDGRWRWLMYDTDHGFGLSSSTTTDMMTQARRSSRGVCQPHFDKLLANTDFRNRFVNRFADLINTAFKPARVQSIISAMAQRVDSEMPRHIERWGRMGSYSAWLSRVTELKDFAAGRPDNALANIVDEFGFGGLAALTVSTTNGAGSVTLNTVTLNASTAGLADPAEPFPWRGTYFKTVPLTLTANPGAGFAFVRWDTPDGEVLDQTFTLTLTNDAAVCAVFEPTVLPRVTVNEFMADATKAGGDLHPSTGKAEDWFELLNESAKTVDLSGYLLVDSQANNACAIPGGVALPPGACLRVWTGSGLTASTNADGSVNATFGLGKSGDAIAVQTPDRATELDRVTFGAQTSNVSQGRWPNGASGAWVSFAKPTPGKPNRNPSAVGLLPLYSVQSAVAGQTLTLSFAPTATVSQAVFAVADGPTGAIVNASGVFTWTPSVALASGVYAFRIALMGLTNGVAVTDETTLLVALSNTQRLLVEGVASPLAGGTVSGGGAYAAGDTATLTASAADGWRFSKWSDGLTARSRSLTVRRDVSYTALFTYGLATPAGVGGTIEGSTPLLYWQAVSGADRYVVRRAASKAGPFAAVGAVSNNVFTDTSPLIGVDAYYTVAACHRDSEGTAAAAFRVYTNGVTRKLDGAIIGTLGSYYNGGNTRDKVFDGDIASFYDAAADGGWPGWDLGVRQPWRLAYIRYVPRTSFPDRMVGGLFQISSASDGTDTFESPETLYTVASTPATEVYTQVPLQLDRTFRYLRYLPPPGGWGNIAELEVYGCDAVPGTPSALTPTSGIRSIALTWSAVANANGYLVRRATAANGPFETVAFAETNAYAESGLSDGTNLFFRVAAVNGSSLSADTAAQAASSAPAPVIPCFSAAGRLRAGEGSGAVTLQLSGALDSRLELVCSDSLFLPVSEWQPVSNAAFSDASKESGAVTISIATNAPQLFFAVRTRK